MKKIVMLPLDERPCNYDFPRKLMEDNDRYILTVPDKSILGKKKQPAVFEDISGFLLDNADADIAVISIDMLLYGGLVPGRLHNESEETLDEKLKILIELKRINPKIKIYAMNLIMRCPQYSSSDEEPDYYERCGREIFLLGRYEHRAELGLTEDGEKEKAEEYRRIIGSDLNDYLARREINKKMNCAVIDYVGKVIDFLIIPQDDSAEFGFMARDQREIKSYIRESRKELSVMIYPGADEVGMVLLSRALLSDMKKNPSFKIMYDSVSAPFIIPKYEDRMLGESIESQIWASGGNIVDNSNSADIILAVNAPGDNTEEAVTQPNNGRGYQINRNLPLFVSRIGNMIKDGKNVAVADVAFCNGGDTELALLLDETGTAMNLAGYAGWNTSGNTLGTAISEAVFVYLFGFTKAHSRFLALRYYEDVGYCSYARAAVSGTLNDFGVKCCNLSNKQPDVTKRDVEFTEKFISSVMPSVFARYHIEKCFMPWNRMFEAGFSIIEK